MRICGSVASSESCLMYILNNKHYDKIAEDFFEEVAQKSQRPMKAIREINFNYAKSLIKPGYFAEIIVPALNNEKNRRIFIAVCVWLSNSDGFK